MSHPFFSLIKVITRSQHRFFIILHCYTIISTLNLILSLLWRLSQCKQCKSLRIVFWKFDISLKLFFCVGHKHYSSSPGLLKHAECRMQNPDVQKNWNKWSSSIYLNRRVSRCQRDRTTLRIKIIITKICVVVGFSRTMYNGQRKPRSKQKKHPPSTAKISAREAWQTRQTVAGSTQKK